MSGFLRRLAERSLGQADTARPVVPPLYADWQRDGALAAPDAGAAADDLTVEDVEETAPPVSRRRPARQQSREPVEEVPAQASPPTGSPSRRSPRAGEAAVQPPIVVEPPPVAPVSALAPPPPNRTGPALLPPAEPAPSNPASIADRRPADRRTTREPASQAAARPATAPAGMPNLAPRPLRRLADVAGADDPRRVEPRLTTLAPAGAPPAAIPRIVAVAPPARRTMAPAAVATQPTEAAGEERIVEISIGRVEIRATPVAATQERAAPAARPALSLEAYLHGRAREGRA